MSSRLASIANQRRRERKQQKHASAVANNIPSPSSSSNSSATRQQPGKYQQMYTLSCEPTASSTTFDDSTIASNWSTDKYSLGLKPTITEEEGEGLEEGGFDTDQSFNFAIPTTICDTNNTGSTGSYKPSIEVTNHTSFVDTTPLRSKAYSAKTKRRVRSSMDSTVTTTTASTTSSSNKTRQTKQTATPHKDNISASSTAVDIHAPTLTTTTNGNNTVTSKLLMKAKLQSATEARNAATKEKNTIISELENKLIDMVKDLELSKGREQVAQLQLKEMARLCEEEVNETQIQVNDVTTELIRIQKINEQMNTNKSMEDSSKRELNDMECEREKYENQWRECLGRLAQVESESQEKDANHEQLESELKQSIKSLQHEKQSILAQTRQQQTQLTNLFNDKQSLEKRYQAQISDLQSELHLHRSSGDNVKQLKTDLAMARQLRDEDTASLQQDMNTMRSEYDDNLKYYKNEVDNLRSQLRGMKGRMENERRDWTTKYDDKLQSMEHEKDTLSQELAQTKNDMECLKSVREKDTQLLESELDKTYKAKVEMEKECKDAKRQLHNALRSLDEMTSSGDKMRDDLEEVVNDFAKEKEHYQNEICHLKKVCEQQKHKLDDLTKHNLELRMNAASLEDNKIPTDGLLLEIQHLKNKLEKAEAVPPPAYTAVATNNEQPHDVSNYKAQITQLESEKTQLVKQAAQHTESVEAQRLNQRETSSELSRAKQTIQILKSKEKYLESRVDSLANQISNTVADYERRLGLTSVGSNESNY